MIDVANASSVMINLEKYNLQIYIFEYEIGSGSIFIFLAVIIAGGVLLEIFSKKIL